MISLLYGSAAIKHAEITPPLYFVAAWVTTHLGHSVLWLRLPSLIAGELSIPVMYLLGVRTVGRRAALVATALTTLSPFMIYYSTEARAYGVMMLLVMGSTLAMLLALDTRRPAWWVLYAVCSCGAVYTHVTSVFVLAAQFLWLCWARPEARRAAVIANLGAVAGLAPWTAGFYRDYTSPTLTILSLLSPFSLHAIPSIVGHWAIGYPYANYDAGVAHLPGPVALGLLALGTIAALLGLGARALRPADRVRGRLSRRMVLVAILLLATPVAEAVISTFSSHIFGVRNLAASWPGLALAFAAVLIACGRRLRWLAVSLALAGFAIGAVLMLSPTYSRPDYPVRRQPDRRRPPSHPGRGRRDGRDQSGPPDPDGRRVARRAAPVPGRLAGRARASLQLRRPDRFALGRRGRRGGSGARGTGGRGLDGAPGGRRDLLAP